MFSLEQAHGIAQLTEPLAALVGVRETVEGWYFPLATDAVGSNGVIVNKRSGRLFRLGSAYAVERDLVLYDRGYQFEKYDLVITSIACLEATVTTLVGSTAGHGADVRTWLGVASRAAHEAR